MSADTSVRWGILGLGSIARKFASDMPHAQTGELVAVASRDPERTAAFAEEFSARAVESYEALLADPEVDAVYIATVHTEHAKWAIRAAQAGKHVLCEKPTTPHAYDTMDVLEAARENSVVFLEGYMYLYHPRTQHLLQLISEGRIGDIRRVEASFSFVSGPDATRLRSPELAGGGILDVGGYPMSISLAIAEATGGFLPTGPSLAPPPVQATGVLSDQGVDLWSTAEVTLPGGGIACLTTGIAFTGEQRVRITGTEGFIDLPVPWTPATDAPAVMTINTGQGEVETLEFTPAHQYACEADQLAAMIGDQEAIDAELGRAEYRGRAMHAWRTQAGVQYPPEHSGAPMPIQYRTTGVPETMTYGRISTSNKSISRLVLGCDNQLDAPTAAVIFDDFFARGGNALDTAYIYGGGLQQKLVGQWMEERGTREETFLIGKGAHTPYCDPESLERQLLESLDALRTDHLDMYFMHRDNEDIPVGEFVDILDTYYQKGVIKGFGGSNWSQERFDAANEYAQAHGKQPFSALSNHFGLAHAYDLPWKGCRHVTDEASKQWLTDQQIPLFPWASQARGFFFRASPNDHSDPELVRCFYSEENFERQRRVRQLATERGTSEAGIVLAYVLQQPFSTFPLIGPRSLSESRTSMEALSIELDQDTVNWLDLREG